MKYNRLFYNRPVTASNTVAGTSVISVKTELDIVKNLHLKTKTSTIKIQTKASAEKILIVDTEKAKIIVNTKTVDAEKQTVVSLNLAKIYVLNKTVEHNIHNYPELKANINISGEILKLARTIYLTEKATISIKANRVASSLLLPIADIDTAKINIKTDKTEYTKLNYIIPKKSTVTINSYARAGIEGIDEMIFNNLYLSPGEELTIDLCDLTAFIENRNVLDKLESDFFKFKAGKNELYIEADTNTEKVILWRDKWL